MLVSCWAVCPMRPGYCSSLLASKRRIISLHMSSGSARSFSKMKLFSLTSLMVANGGLFTGDELVMSVVFWC